MSKGWFFKCDAIPTVTVCIYNVQIIFNLPLPNWKHAGIILCEKNVYEQLSKLLHPITDFVKFTINLWQSKKWLFNCLNTCEQSCTMTLDSWTGWNTLLFVLKPWTICMVVLVVATCKHVGLFICSIQFTEIYLK